MAPLKWKVNFGRQIIERRRVDKILKHAKLLADDLSCTAPPGH